MRSKICLAAVAMLLFVAGVGAQTKYVVSAGAKSGQFSVKKDGATVSGETYVSNGAAVSGATNVSIDAAMIAIRKDANGGAVEINFDTTKGGVNIEAGSIKIGRANGPDPNWGDVMITGSVIGKGIVLQLTSDTGMFNVRIVGKISVIGGSGGAIELTRRVALRMDACTLTTEGKYLVGLYIERFCNNVSIEINGGKYKSAGGNVIYNTVGPVKITGGEFEAGNGYAVRARGALNISGGRFVSGTGTALFFDNGEAIINGGAEIVNNSDVDAAILLSGGNVLFDDIVVTNRNRNGRAVFMSGSPTVLTLGGSIPPRISGSIASRFAGAIKIGAKLDPADTYTLEPMGGACVNGAVAVFGGEKYRRNFDYRNNYYELGTKNGNIVVDLKGGVTAPSYIVTGDTTDGFVATIENKTGDAVIGRSMKIEDVIDYIRLNADGRPCGIRFGDGVSVLDAGRMDGISFSAGNAGAEWGRITLTGKMSTDRLSVRFNRYALNVRDGISVESRMDNPSTNHTGSVYVSSGSEFILNGGSLCGLINNNGGKVTVAGGTVPRINNVEGGLLKITGGVIGSDTLSGYAVDNAEGCEVYISGDAAIVSANTSVNGGTIINKGLLDISGGAIAAKGSGYALVTSGAQGTVVSGNANITAANRNGAVYIGADGRLRLYGGTISSVDSTAKAIEVYVGDSKSAAGRLEMCGSPTVVGVISLPGGEEPYIKVITDSGYVFNPNGKNYRVSAQTLDGDVIVEDGAAFFHNFTLDAIGNKKLLLAVDGNDIVSAKTTCNVAFNINGSLSNLYPPATITVIRDGTIGILAKPSTEGYVSRYGYLNDGEWYNCIAVLDEGNMMSPSPFSFSGNGGGTRVTENMTLTLRWTGEISVLESNRDLPAARPTETAVITPISAAPVSLTAGPNPISRSLGAVNFFHSGVPLRNGKLFIYDASGNIVTTVVINDPSNSTGKRIVSSWKINDIGERQIADGTYAARGVITTKAGKTEKISILINVQR